MSMVVSASPRPAVCAVTPVQPLPDDAIPLTPSSTPGLPRYIYASDTAMSSPPPSIGCGRPPSAQHQNLAATRNRCSRPATLAASNVCSPPPGLTVLSSDPPRRFEIRNIQPCLGPKAVRFSVS
ncbi:hypothetical protein FA13DRAFT_1800582 [Coprinellus micaceus]|uniref:Uncharacterized protein n=1 Tax=Coprinellus micaceus TaxID=71717 RepID=A0A4Y7SGN9_COPMI|nr:hypothetical protein FA13DRAFT_1800582 [Coprinellus micaceus]